RLSTDPRRSHSRCGSGPDRRFWTGCNSKYISTGGMTLTRRLLLLLLITLASCSRPDRIVIGSKNFTEQVILGELVAQAIERQAHLPVDRRLNLGGTLICHQAITSGQMDIYVEYTGTALTAILKQSVVNDATQVYEQVKSAYRDQFKVEWTEPLGFNNTFVI